MKTTVPYCWLCEGSRPDAEVGVLDPRPMLPQVPPPHGRRFLRISCTPSPGTTVVAVTANGGGSDGCACAVLLVVVEGEVGGGGGGGGGGCDSSAARCWSFDPAHEIGTHGVRAGHTIKYARTQHLFPLTENNFAL